MTCYNAQAFDGTLKLIDQERENLFEAMDDYDESSEEYKEIWQRMLDLQKVEESVVKQRLESERNDREDSRAKQDAEPRKLSADTKFAGWMTLGSIVVIVIIEQLGGIFTTKAAGFIPKLNLR